MAAMEVMEAMAATDTARGPLMLMPTTATEAMAVLAMEVMVDTDTARGPLMPMPTTVMEAMAVLAMVMAPMDMASNFSTKHKNSHRTKNLHFSILDLNLFLGKSHNNHELNKI